MLASSRSARLALEEDISRVGACLPAQVPVVREDVRWTTMERCRVSVRALTESADGKMRLSLVAVTEQEINKMAQLDGWGVRKEWQAGCVETRRGQDCRMKRRWLVIRAKQWRRSTRAWSQRHRFCLYDTECQRTW